MSAHTPGPWWFAADAPDTYAIGAGDIELAGGLRRENARLMAAAPELLEALRNLITSVDRIEWDCTENAAFGRLDDARSVARAALAKVQP